MQKDTKNTRSKETVQQIKDELVSEIDSGTHVKRTYKSRLFEMLFSEKKALHARH